MTVAAVILAATADAALADVEGQPCVRRLSDVAWSGGAIPVVVVAPDPDGKVSAALRGAPALLVAPAPATSAGGPAAQMARGLEAARETVAETSAAILWPARHVWVDPETLTALIEAHGADRETIFRPAYRGQAGWPLLLPLEAWRALQRIDRAHQPDEIADDLAASGIPLRLLDLGDPGTTRDAATERESLPAFEGPPSPVAGQPPEWGAGVAEPAGD